MDMKILTEIFFSQSRKREGLEDIIIIIIFIIYKAQYPKMLKALYNKIKSYLLFVKTNINNNKYNWSYISKEAVYTRY